MAQVRERFRPRWSMGMRRWSGPTGKVQVNTTLRREVRDADTLHWPEPLLRLAQEEYDRQFPGQPYERMQERGGMSVHEVVTFLADAIERQRWEASRTATTEEASPHG